MLVKELISMLSQYDGDMIVGVGTIIDDDDCPINAFAIENISTGANLPDNAICIISENYL